VAAQNRLPLTQARVQELLHYDPDSGDFRWLKRVSHTIQIGDIAGTLTKSGYWAIHIDRRQYPAHQLAWLYMTGTWGRPLIDHRDLDRTNNRWANLRVATPSANCANRRRYRNNASGFKGVHLDQKSGRWRAGIRKDGRSYELGLFATPEAAHGAYVAAARQLFGEFARME
jgi:hypothetical protein